MGLDAQSVGGDAALVPRIGSQQQTADLCVTDCIVIGQHVSFTVRAIAILDFIAIDERKGVGRVGDRCDRVRTEGVHGDRRAGRSRGRSQTETADELRGDRVAVAEDHDRRSIQRDAVVNGDDVVAMSPHEGQRTGERVRALAGAHRDLIQFVVARRFDGQFVVVSVSGRQACAIGNGDDRVEVGILEIQRSGKG